MRVLNINKFYYLRGGAERYFFALTELLEAQGHEVIPFSMQDERNFPSKFSKYFVRNLELGKPGLRMINELSRSVWSLEVQKSLEALLDEYPPDIAHVHLIYHHLSPSLLATLKKRNIPVVMTLHDYKLICPNYLLYTEGSPCKRCKKYKYHEAVIHKCLKDSYAVSAFAAAEMGLHKLIQVYEKNVDTFIAPSEFVKNVHVEFGQDPQKVVVIPHFISERFLSAPKPAASALEPYMLFFGRLVPEKGLDKLLETLYIYKPSMKLKIAGTGPLSAWVESYVQARGLSGQVELLGHLETPELIETIRRASLVVMPSRFLEPFGFAALESIALGTPVVAFASGGLTETITPDVGRLVPLDDKAELVKAIEEVKTWDHARVYEKAQELIKQKYLPKQHYDSLKVVYDHLVH